MRCIFAWTHAYVEYDGKLKPCCAPVEFGRIDEKGIPETFSSRDANILRRSMANDSKESIPKVCQNCLNLPRLAGNNAFDDFFPLSERKMGDLEKDGHSAFVENYKVVRESFMKGNPLPPDSKPLQVMVQLGEHCNLRCVMCPQDHDHAIKIDRKYIEKTKELMPTLYGFSFSGGEPLVYREFWELAGHFQRHAVPIARFSTLTNAILLTKDKLHNYLKDINNFGIGVNIDSCTKETYEKIRRGAKWETLMQNIYDFDEFRTKYNKNWGINLAVTIMKSNLDELSGAIKLASELGAGFGCGMITGEHAPIKNCRTYFEENIFRFSHLGYTKQEILDKLNEALNNVSLLKKEHREAASSNINGVIDYLQKTDRIDIPAKKVARMRALNDVDLSREILAYMTGAKSDKMKAIISRFIKRFRLQSVG